MLFGDMLARGRLDIPMVGDWLSSDRPPLQVGLYLMLYKLLPHNHVLVYQEFAAGRRRWFCCRWLLCSRGS